MAEKIRTFSGRIWRYIIIALEIVAAIGALVAFYEIFFARKTVPTLGAVLEICDLEDIEQTGIADFLATQDEKFVYLDLDFIQNPIGCEGTAAAQNDVYLHFDEARLQIGSASIKKELEDGSVQLVPVQSVLEFSPNSFEDYPIGRVSGEFAEDPGYLGLEGIFFVKAEMGEGLYYNKLIAAPINAQTEKFRRCSEIVYSYRGIQRVRSYISSCIF